MRRDGRVVDGGGLENHCTRKGTGGSNPSPSANLRSPAFVSELRLASQASSRHQQAKVAHRSAQRGGGLSNAPCDLRVTSQPSLVIKCEGCPAEAPKGRRRTFLSSNNPRALSVAWSGWAGAARGPDGGLRIGAMSGTRVEAGGEVQTLRCRLAGHPPRVPQPLHAICLPTDRGAFLRLFQTISPKSPLWR